MMRLQKNLGSLALVLLLALSIASWKPVLAQEPEALSFEHAEPLIVTGDQLDRGVSIHLFNNTSRSLQLVLVINDIVGDSEVRPLSTAVQIEGERERQLEPTELVAIRLSARGAEPTAGTFAGYLVAYVPDSNTVARKHITLMVRRGKHNDQPALPLAKEWSLSAQRPLPYWLASRLGRPEVALRWAAQPCMQRPCLPLALGSKSVAVPTATLGYLAGEEGQVALAHARAVLSGTTVTTTTWLVLRFEGLQPPGNYKGILSLNPPVGGDESKVTLSVRVSDAWWLLLVALLLGMLITYFYQQFPVSISKLLSLQERRRRLTAKRTEPKTQRRLTDGYAGYTTTRDIEAKQVELDRILSSLRRYYVYGEIDKDERYDEAKRLLNGLEFHLKDDAWEEFRTAHQDLREQLDMVAAYLEREQLSGPVDLSTGSRIQSPRFLGAARTWLKGGPITIEEFAERRVEMSATSYAATEWPGLNTRVMRCQIWVQAIRDHVSKLTQEQLAELIKAEEGLSAIWRALWNNEPREAWAYGSIRDDLEQFEGSLARLNSVLDRAHWYQMLAQLQTLGIDTLVAEGLARSRYSGGGGAGGGGGGWLPDISETTRDKVLAAFYRFARVGSSGAFFLLSLIVALLGGFEFFYFDKIFGTPLDYLRAVLWGLAAPAAVGYVSLVLTNLQQLLREADGTSEQHGSTSRDYGTRGGGGGGA